LAKFANYGMAGIGIAAAIGFVFALSVASNNNALLTGSVPAQQSTAPYSTMTPKIQPQPDNTSTPSGEGTAAKMAASNESFADSQTARTDLRLTLTSVVALNAISREIISVVTPQTEFKLGAPVFIQANLANGNENEISQQTVVVRVNSYNGNNSLAADTAQNSGNENIVIFKGDVAKGANISLDLYWKPSRAGEFTILVFSNTPEDSASTAPIATIPVRVIE